MGRYDALLVVSFGGPEKPEDVMPFLENVVRGRGVPRERLLEVEAHYQGFGGVSPINGQCRDLIEALRPRVGLPIYWGNRNWHPFLADTLRQMAADGVTRAAAFITAAYSSYSSCRQYLDDIARARAEVPGAPEVVRLRHYFDHPGFIAAMTDHTREALDRLPPELRADARLVFTAHSIPVSMAASSGPSGGAYEAQLRATASLVAGDRPWDLVWQSRSGPPQVPWLEPDVCDHLEALAAAGAPAVVLVPIGFVSDHMEVVYDLDTEAAAKARELGLPMTRAATAGTHPRFVSMVAELLAEPEPAACGAACCPAPRRPGRPESAGSAQAAQAAQAVQE
ncbi:putative ferrochelatase [Sphaerisporangium siamense]|uniref:Coproporphyrin III ferrochelatase n=1 Tax=Sphaerisporangium siamense TaxID=795645 RepID=A0A7W7D9F5_9ACTN|nr:ferrochelatase [Sphaerisporangium siamense]MBB4702692.1 ferrochelatase [Sphaerisporangium siamense]GII83553.1 putative ferrochelatase [Sphaerisporangium siamense]